MKGLVNRERNLLAATTTSLGLVMLTQLLGSQRLSIGVLIIHNKSMGTGYALSPYLATDFNQIVGFSLSLEELSARFIPLPSYGHQESMGRRV